jgi:hypothetical protein
MSTSQEEKNYVAVYSRVLMDFFNPPEWGPWGRTHKCQNYYYGFREKYLDVHAAIAAAQRKIAMKQAEQSYDNSRVIEYKVVKITEVKICEDI